MVTTVASARSRASGADRAAEPDDAARPQDAAGAGDAAGHAGTGSRRPRLVELCVVGAVAFGLVLVILGPFPLNTPVVYARDTFQHLAVVETADWTGSPQRVDWLGAPHGSDWGLFPTGGERLHVVVLHALRSLTGSSIAALNLHVLLALVLTAVVAHAVLRRIGCRPIVAGAAACLFTFSPSALQRLASGHLFLFGLFPVALGVFAVLWALDRAPARSWPPGAWRSSGGGRGREWVAPLAAVAVIAVSSTYYAIFTALLLVATAGIRALRRGDARCLAPAVVLVLALGAVSAATLAPDLLARRGEPAVAAALERPVSDSETYGLRPAQMLMPRADHPVPALARLGERADRTRSSGEAGAVLGLAGVAGLVALGIVALRRSARRAQGAADPGERAEQTVDERAAVRTPTADDEHHGALDRLSGLAAVAIALGTAGGGGFVLAVLGFTQVRVWSRLAAYVLFCALAGLGLLAQRRWAGSPRFSYLVVLVAILAMADQGAWIPNHTAQRAALREDQALVADLLDALPAGAVVAQLPVVPFPDHIGSERLLAPALLAEGRLRTTAGAFRGSEGDWQESWLAGTGAGGDGGDADGGAARAAAVAGADVLLVQRTHRAIRDADGLEQALEASAGVPARRSDGGTWSWLDLRALRAELTERHGAAAVTEAGRQVTRPVGLEWDGLARLDFAEDGSAIAHLGPDGALMAHSRDGDDAPLEVRFRVDAADGTTVEVVTGSERRRVRPGAEGTEVVLEVRPDAGTALVQVRAEGTALHVRGADGPVLARVTQLTVRDLAATRNPVLVGH